MSKHKLSSQFTVFRLTANVLGLGSTTFKGNDGGMLLSLYKLIIFFCVGLCLLDVLISREMAYVGYNILSTAGIFLQASTMLLFIMTANISTAYWQNTCYKFYEELENISDYLKKRFQKSISLYRPINYYVLVVLITFVALAVSDILLTDQFITVQFSIAVHLPGITSVIYISHFNALLNACTKAFGVINNYLEEFTLPHLSTMEKISISLQDIAPEKTIFNQGNRKSTANFQQVFIIHTRIRELVRKINAVIGLNLIGLILAGGGASLCLLYNITMYFVTKLQIRDEQWHILYSEGFWALVYFGEIIAVVYTAQELKKSSGRIGIILHKLINLYPEADELVNIYSIQLLDENTTITAANCYVLNGNFLPDVATTMATLVAIAIQFDENYLLKNPKSPLLEAAKLNNSTTST